MKDDIPTRSICRFIAILQVINRLGPVSLLTIAKEIDIPYPTVSRVIQTLLESELIERVENTKCYRASGKTLSLSSGFTEHDRLVLAARQRMIALTGRIGWPLALATRVGSSMVVRDSTHHLTSLAFSRCPIGFKIPLLDSAAGHVCLSYAPDEERECVLIGLEHTGGRSPMMALFKSGKPVARIREDGFATYERGQRSLDPGKISSIAVPILRGDELVGVLTLMLFASAMPMADALQRYLRELRSTAADIANALSSSEVVEAPVVEAPRPAVEPRAAVRKPLPEPAIAALAERRMFADVAQVDATAVARTRGRRGHPLHRAR